VIIIWTLFVGLIIGAVAKCLMPVRNPGVVVFTIILGILGSSAGTAIGAIAMLFRAGSGVVLVMPVVGATVLMLLLYRSMTVRRPSSIAG
jgi:uncharacterized membrane protein YeaQ/YmgE (transglycosylase-associated protein family)